MKILAIESSCDETAAAVVENGQVVLSNVIASSAAKHAETKGVVPEVAAREHMKVILPTVELALSQAACDWSAIDAIAVTWEPGLLGSLLVGRATAQALAYALDKPLIRVNHIHGHVYSTWLEQDDEPQFPILTLTVSGGHNLLVYQRGHGDMEILGSTRDDSAGEAFDKVARILDLGYPGGPAIETLARTAVRHDLRFPRAHLEGFDFSFSGLKTSVLYHVKAHPIEDDAERAEIAWAFQEAAIDALLTPLFAVLEDRDVREVHLTGGVSANLRFREKLSEGVGPGLRLRFPARMIYCTDNAAMIGAAGYFDKARS